MNPAGAPGATASRPVFLLTDFGPGSHFSGIMRAVIAGRGGPGIRILDLAHDIPAFAIEAGALVLDAAFDFLPPSAIVVAVVDPGVGTERAVLAFRSGGKTVLAPDNGLLTPLILQDPRALVVEIRRGDLFLPVVSATFQGRDVFSPVAAELARGFFEENLGPVVRSPVLIPDFWPRAESARVVGRVIHVDAFGNLITNLRADDLLPALESPRIIAGAVSIPRLERTYSDVASGSLLAYFGSSGTIEIAVRDGRADDRLGMRRGDPVTAERSEDPT